MIESYYSPNYVKNCKCLFYCLIILANFTLNRDINSTINVTPNKSFSVSWGIKNNIDINTVTLLLRNSNSVSEIAMLIYSNVFYQKLWVNASFENNGIIVQKCGFYIERFPIHIENHSLEIKISYTEVYYTLEEFVENVKIGKIKICKLFIKNSSF